MIGKFLKLNKTCSKAQSRWLALAKPRENEYNIIIKGLTKFIIFLLIGNFIVLVILFMIQSFIHNVGFIRNKNFVI